jgi:hypothetical protein
MWFISLFWAFCEVNALLHLHICSDRSFSSLTLGIFGKTIMTVRMSFRRFDSRCGITITDLLPQGTLIYIGVREWEIDWKLISEGKVT